MEDTLDSELGGESIAPDEAFKAVGNELRIEILRALARALEPVPFTTLQETVGMEDSGKFNYHLGKLTGHFVRRTDRGYELRHAGASIVRAIRAGGITEDPTLEPRTIDLPCPFCGADQEFSYAQETLQLRCPECAGVAEGPFPNGTIMYYEFPVAGLRSRTELEVARAAHRLYDSEVVAMVEGVCPLCAGQVDVELSVCFDHEPGEDGLCNACDSRYLAWCDCECPTCHHSRRFALWFRALLHPGVVGFYADAGDVSRPVPFPKLLTGEDPDFRDVTETLRSRDPLQIAVEIRAGDGACTVLVDENLDVTLEDSA
ncbi:MAG: helix-turn-helix domain-containing protein [Haloferacaceae archaeon]